MEWGQATVGEEAAFAHVGWQMGGLVTTVFLFLSVLKHDCTVVLFSPTSIVLLDDLF